MAYQNINFPTIKLKHGFQENNLAPVIKLSNFAKEYRIQKYTTQKRYFTFPARNMTMTDWTTIYNFLVTVKFETDSFNLIHPFTGNSIKVRLDGIPSTSIIAMNSSNQPIIVSVSDINLIEVFNE